MSGWFAQWRQRKAIDRLYKLLDEGDYPVLDRELKVAEEGNEDLDVLRCYLYMRTGRAEQAVSLAKLLLGKQADNPSYRMLHGEALLAAGQLDGAIEELRAALNMDKQNARTLHLLGRLHARQGDLETAERYLDLALIQDKGYFLVRLTALLEQVSASLSSTSRPGHGSTPASPPDDRLGGPL